MAIKSVDEFIDAIGGETVNPSGTTSTPHNLERPVEWGPPTSLEGQDAFSRLGVGKVGSMIKVSAAFHGVTHTSLTRQRHQLVKEAQLGAFMGNLARRGLQAGGKALSKFLPRAAKTTARTAPKGGMLGRLSRWGATEVLPAGGRAGNFMSHAPGLGIDAGLEADNLRRVAGNKPSMFAQFTGGR